MEQEVRNGSKRVTYFTLGEHLVTKWAWTKITLACSRKENFPGDRVVD